MELLSKKLIKKSLSIIFIIYIIGLTLNILFGVQSIGTYSFVYLFYLSFIVGVLVGIYAIKRVSIGSLIGRTLLGFTLANSLIIISYLFWDYHFFLGKSYVSYPEIGNILFYLFPVVITLSIFSLLKIYSIKMKPVALISALAIFMILAPVLMTVLGEPQSFFEGAYVFTSAILITLPVLLLMTKNKRILIVTTSHIFAMVLMVVADIMYTREVATAIYQFGSLSDMLYIISGGLYSLGIYNIAKSIFGKTINTNKYEQIQNQGI